MRNHNITSNSNLLSDKSKDSNSPFNYSKTNKRTPYKKPVSVKLLEEMYLAFQKQKYPGIPDKVLVKQPYRDDTANGLTKCIIDYIRFTGGQAERINTTGRPIDRRTTYTDVIGRRRVVGSIEWIPGTSTNGSADISATIKGRSVKIEVKIGKDRQSAVQKQYQEAIENAGGIYLIAKDFTSFYEWVNLTFKSNCHGK